MEYYQKLNIKKKKEIEIEEEYIKNLDIEILKKETQFKDFKEKIEIKINVYQKEIENLKINKFEININELDSKIDCNNKNILNYEDKIESQNKDFIIQENNLEKEKEKKENEYQKELNNVDEQKHKISLLKKKKNSIENLKNIKINEINQLKNFKILKKKKIENLKNRKFLINDSINYILTKKFKEMNDLVIQRKIKSEENNLLKFKEERKIGIKKIIDNYQENLNSDNIIEKIKDKDDKINSYNYETQESLFFIKNKINILKKKLTLKNEILKQKRTEDIILLKNRFEDNLKLFNNNEKLKKKKKWN